MNITLFINTKLSVSYNPCFEWKLKSLLLRQICVMNWWFCSKLFCSFVKIINNAFSSCQEWMNKIINSRTNENNSLKDNHMRPSSNMKHFLKRELVYNELGYNEHSVIANKIFIPKWPFRTQINPVKTNKLVPSCSL